VGSTRSRKPPALSRSRKRSSSSPPGLIAATIAYVETLLRCRSEGDLAQRDLRGFAPAAFATGAISYFAPYEEVHRRNVAAVTAVAQG